MNPNAPKISMLAGVIEKKTMINLVYAFSVATKASLYCGSVDTYPLPPPRSDNSRFHSTCFAMSLGYITRISTL